MMMTMTYVSESVLMLIFVKYKSYIFLNFGSRGRLEIKNKKVIDAGLIKSYQSHSFILTSLFLFIKIGNEYVLEANS